MTSLARTVVSVVLLVGTLLVLNLRSSGEAVPIRQPLDRFPGVLGDWRAAGGTIFDVDTLNVLKPTDYVMRRYLDPHGQNLWLFIAYWDTQRKGAQPHSPKNCLPGAGWEPLDSSQLSISLPQPLPPITVNQYLIQKDHEQLLVLYWYQSQGKTIPDEWRARVEMVRSSITRHRTDGALVRITGPVKGGIQETSARLVGYVRVMYPYLAEYLPD
jgi:EpsI family protein